MNERVRVKFCGFTRAGDVAEACALGVDAIGLIMTRRSRRFVDIEQAAALRAAVPPFVAVVTLLLDDEAAWVDEVISRVAPDLLQFHGDEPAERCAAFGRRYLKAVPMGSVADVHAYVRSHPQAAGFLLDSHVPGGQGGSGVGAPPGTTGSTTGRACRAIWPGRCCSPAASMRATWRRPCGSRSRSRWTCPAASKAHPASNVRRRCVNSCSR